MQKKIVLGGLVSFIHLARMVLKNDVRESMEEEFFHQSPETHLLIFKLLTLCGPGTQSTGEQFQPTHGAKDGLERNGSQNTSRWVSSLLLFVSPCL